MTRLAALTATAVAAGIPAEQAEELVHQLAAAVPSSVEDAAIGCIEYRVDQGWLPEPSHGDARLGHLAEQLAAAWCAHDKAVEARVGTLEASVAWTKRLLEDARAKRSARIYPEDLMRSGGRWLGALRERIKWLRAGPPNDEIPWGSNQSPRPPFTMAEVEQLGAEATAAGMSDDFDRAEQLQSEVTAATAALRRLAAVIEYRAGFGTDGANAEAREALTAAWEVLGPEVREQERLASGCAHCGDPLTSADGDLCAACAQDCAETMPEPGGAW